MSSLCQTRLREGTNEASRRQPPFCPAPHRVELNSQNCQSPTRDCRTVLHSGDGTRNDIGQPNLRGPTGKNVTPMAQRSVPTLNNAGTGLPVSRIPAAAVSAMPQRSPLRYPGGKTWLIPHIRAWLEARDEPLDLFIEPFAGGATATLTAVMEKYAARGVMAEIDPDVAAFWSAALHHSSELQNLVRSFTPTRNHVERLDRGEPTTVIERAFRTLVRNRTRRGGIMAPGSAALRAGEYGQGVAARWYAQTLIHRLAEIDEHARRLTFIEGDGLNLIATHAGTPRIAIFADPPYIGAGRRLYATGAHDYEALFAALDDSGADFMLTCDVSEQAIDLIHRHAFAGALVAMRNTHHATVHEIVITRTPLFAAAGGSDTRQ